MHAVVVNAPPKQKKYPLYRQLISFSSFSSLSFDKSMRFLRDFRIQKKKKRKNSRKTKKNKAAKKNAISPSELSFSFSPRALSPTRQTSLYANGSSLSASGSASSIAAKSRKCAGLCDSS